MNCDTGEVAERLENEQSSSPGEPPMQYDDQLCSNIYTTVYEKCNIQKE